MGIINSMFGTASEIDAGALNAEFEPLLAEGEEITAAFKVVRDLFVFTQKRLILADKQGLTGKKVDYHSIPYKSISQFSVETAGSFDLDAELRIWISSASQPITKEFKKGTDIVGIQKQLATYVLAA
ncbi:MAG: PH domain-containing protein [Verrucomicrobiota bacterium]